MSLGNTSNLHYAKVPARMVSPVVKGNSPKEIKIQKYGRYWGIYLNSELLAVVVYKKGALALKNFIEREIFNVNEPKSS